MDAGTDNGFTFTAPNWPSEPKAPVARITSKKPSHPANSFFYPDLDQLPPIATFTFVKSVRIHATNRTEYEELAWQLAANCSTAHADDVTTSTAASIPNDDQPAVTYRCINCDGTLEPAESTTRLDCVRITCSDPDCTDLTWLDNITINTTHFLCVPNDTFSGYSEDAFKASFTYLSCSQFNGSIADGVNNTVIPSWFESNSSLYSEQNSSYICHTGNTSTTVNYTTQETQERDWNTTLTGNTSMTVNYTTQDTQERDWNTTLAGNTSTTVNYTTLDTDEERDWNTTLTGNTSMTVNYTTQDTQERDWNTTLLTTTENTTQTETCINPDAISTRSASYFNPTPEQLGSRVPTFNEEEVADIDELLEERVYHLSVESKNSSHARDPLEGADLSNDVGPAPTDGVEAAARRVKSRILKKPNRHVKGCHVSEWSEWSPCSVSCGVGDATRTRKVLAHPRRGGKPCPALEEKRWCGGHSECPQNFFNW